MEKIRNLINQVAIISKKNAEILDATGGRFNMFQVCGVNHYENTHSAIIAEFLDPNGTHGLKSKLLECFIETLGERVTIKSFNCEKAQVRTEHSTEEGRIDILITDDQNKAIIIENKIYAADQLEQLKRYDSYAQKTYKYSYQILYLTLWGDEASEQSGENVPYSQVSYKADIICWLEKCVALASRFPMVRETIIQYVNHLKQLTGQDMNTKNKEEITKVLSENFRAAYEIYQNYPGVYDYLAKELFNPKMREFAEQKGLGYHYDRVEERAIHFRFTHQNWQGKCWIEFTCEGNRCFYGLRNILPEYKMSVENRKRIHDKLKVSSLKESNWFPFYVYINNLSPAVWEADIIKSDKFLNDCKEKIENFLKIMEEIEL